MTTHRITYSSNDQTLQWRCHLRMLIRHRRLLLLQVASVALLLAVNTPISMILSLYVFFFLSLALLIANRCRGKRLVTTTISEAGVRDILPESDRLVVWADITRVEIVAGDLYYFTRSNGIFVPRSAFPDKQTGSEFFEKSLTFWHRARNTALLSSDCCPTCGTNLDSDRLVHLAQQAPNIEVEDDEDVWKELEARHKANLNGNTSQALETEDIVQPV